MSDFAIVSQPAHDRLAFAGRIQAILDRGWPTMVALAPGALEVADGWTSQPDARLVVMLDGAQRYDWCGTAGPTWHRLRPGEALWLAPGAPMREDWSEPCAFLGIVLRPHFLRFLVGQADGSGHHPGASPWAHHASLPLGEPGTLVASALNRLAEGHGDAASAPELLRALLRLARDHAARCTDEAPGKAAATWRRVQEHIAANCHRELGRASTAAALGLNPTYLSDLCRRRGGAGFAGLVEQVRLERARLLLRTDPALSIREVAQRVGFASAGYFARVFRRATGASPVAWRAG